MTEYTKFCIDCNGGLRLRLRYALRSGLRVDVWARTLDKLRIVRTYISDAFDWDETKAAANYAKHGVSFETATKVLKDPLPSNDSMAAKIMVKTVTS